MNTGILIYFIAAYLFGAIPFGLLIAKVKGVDLRSVGSGNIGATNVFRTLGKPLGFLTFALDALKGFIPAFYFPCFACDSLPLGSGGLLFGFAAIAGHNWPIYLKFKGGKGVATSAGVLFAVAPLAAAIGMLAFGISLKLSRIVSLSSMTAAVIIAGLSWMLYLKDGTTIPTALSILALVVVFQHRGNIKRVLDGTEPRIPKKKKGEEHHEEHEEREGEGEGQER